MKLLRNRPAREWLRALKEDGFRLIRQKGSHRTFGKEHHKVTLAYHHLNDTFPPGVVDSILRGTGWTEEDLNRLGLLKQTPFFPAHEAHTI